EHGAGRAALRLLAEQGRDHDEDRDQPARGGERSERLHGDGCLGHAPRYRGSEAADAAPFAPPIRPLAARIRPPAPFVRARLPRPPQAAACPTTSGAPAAACSSVSPSSPG